ncbi:hypothetical protein [Aureimonas phyllosphaerae]|uniref:Uncharacterized protein n=1 Tax=Aureimonas phyllosphaerae TaxID=1166078 RepID=A0A7W6C0G8_9HYPH|nr:hypothetical protein [Aureimonas phyllosphaerae]MBB3938155.1 hypothetical protein [Aureimonas phyllosphaerae]MBB3962163.1 hypothetical protein [Aureimonas phyllosphaerae]SFF56615.1 hypothetical protein SAMN05216566_13017 [Aureimonas phyllosphaerae]
MPNLQTRIPRELRAPEKTDRDSHGNRVFEIVKEARLAADPNRTAHSLAQIAMWLESGSMSNVALAPADLSDVEDALNIVERHAYTFLPKNFDRNDIALMFQTWQALVLRWSQLPAERPQDAGAQNLRDLARVWRNQLHSTVLIQDVRARLGRSRRFAATIHDLLHLPANFGSNDRGLTP